MLIFFGLGSLALGQNDTTKNGELRSRFRPGLGWFYTGFSPAKSKQNVKYDRLMVDLVYNDWHGDRSYLKSPWQSIGFTISMLFDFPMARNDVASFGLGIAYSHYTNRTPVKFTRHFKDNYTTIADYTKAEMPDQSRFGANFIEVPIEFRFRTKGWQHFKVMIGGKIGYNFSSFFKETNKIKGQKYEQKYTNFPDLNPLRYGVTLRIGMRNWALFGAYYFSPLFTNNKSVKLYPISMGITISLF